MLMCARKRVVGAEGLISVVDRIKRMLHVLVSIIAQLIIFSMDGVMDVKPNIEHLDSS